MSYAIYPFIFGNNSETFFYNATLADDTKFADKATLDTADIIYNLVLNGIRETNATAKLKGFIYSDNGGIPDALIAVTDEIVGIEVGLPVILPFSSPVNLSAGDYWLGVITNSYIYLYGSSYASNNNFIASDTYADGPNDPFGAYSGSLQERVIYAADVGTPMMAVSRAQAYAILNPSEGVNIAQTLGYAVLESIVDTKKPLSIIIA